MDAEELLRRYAAGERDFASVDLSGINLARGDAKEGEQPTVPDILHQAFVGCLNAV